jgi:hypothetical protein
LRAAAVTNIANVYNLTATTRINLTGGNNITFEHFVRSIYEGRTDGEIIDNMGGLLQVAPDFVSHGVEGPVLELRYMPDMNLRFPGVPGKATNGVYTPIERQLQNIVNKLVSINGMVQKNMDGNKMTGNRLGGNLVPYWRDPHP